MFGSKMYISAILDHWWNAFNKEWKKPNKQLLSRVCLSSFDSWVWLRGKVRWREHQGYSDVLSETWSNQGLAENFHRQKRQKYKKIRKVLTTWRRLNFGEKLRKARCPFCHSVTTNLFLFTDKLCTFFDFSQSWRARSSSNNYPWRLLEPCDPRSRVLFQSGKSGCRLNTLLR